MADWKGIIRRTIYAVLITLIVSIPVSLAYSGFDFARVGTEEFWIKASAVAISAGTSAAIIQLGTEYYRYRKNS